MLNRLSFFPFLLIFLIMITSCRSSRKVSVNISINNKSVSETKKTPGSDFESKIKIKKDVAPIEIDTKDVSTDKVAWYAKTLIGKPYVYGSCDKNKGFDCSGFIWHVFDHFNIKVPRTSSDFTHAGKEIKAAKSKVGDLILFTGSDKSSGKVGHMGMIVQNNDNGFKFIHSATGGVQISGMSTYYYDRFVKVIRIFR